MIDLDKLDLDICYLIRRNPSLPLTQLQEEEEISSQVFMERIEKLKKAGVLSGNNKVNLQALGYTVSALVELEIAGGAGELWEEYTEDQKIFDYLVQLNSFTLTQGDDATKVLVGLIHGVSLNEIETTISNFLHTFPEKLVRKALIRPIATELESMGSQDISLPEVDEELQDLMENGLDVLSKF